MLTAPSSFGIGGERRGTSTELRAGKRVKSHLLKDVSDNCIISYLGPS